MTVTLASPTSSRPRRWIIPIRPIAYWVAMSFPMRSSTGHRHLLVALVFQIARSPPVRIVPDHPLKDHQRAVLRPLQFASETLRVDRQSRQSCPAKFPATRYLRRPSTHRRQERDFIVFSQDRVGPRKLTISG